MLPGSTKQKAEQGRVVLLLLGHGVLQREYVLERAALIVRKDAAHAVRVADVHVAVEKAGRHHHVPGVDHAVRGDARQLRGLAHARDLRAVEENRPALDDAPLLIDRDDVPRVGDLEGRWHGGASLHYDLAAGVPAGRFTLSVQITGRWSEATRASRLLCTWNSRPSRATSQ